MTAHVQAARLLVAIVRSGRGDYVAKLAREAGATGCTVLFGRGTGSNNIILRLLGLADTEKELVFTVSDKQLMPAIVHILKNTPDLCRKVSGIGFVIDVLSFFRPSDVNDKRPIFPKGRNQMKQSGHELICAIVNAGLADDVMHDARKAGARGGTILRARGTATGQDCSFFGIAIVPEKEFLMILSSRAHADTIAEAVAGAKCLSEPGSGVVFRMPVEDFFQLGAGVPAKS